MITLINDARIAAGKPALGFLNPWLYSVGYKGFRDVTIGSAIGCGVEGFPAVEGWDPVTGFGTPNFPELVKIVNENQKYARCALFIGDKKSLTEDSLHDLAAQVDDDETRRASTSEPIFKEAQPFIFRSNAAIIALTWLDNAGEYPTFGGFYPRVSGCHPKVEY